MKRVAKAFTLFVASTVYVWLLLLTATTISASFALREPDTLKRWLDDSGVYTNVVDEVSKLATIQQKQENSVVQITSDDIQSTARQAFTPDSIQQDAEGVIDGFYGWFKGESVGPEFEVDFSGRQALFATGMTAKLEQKINQLPECETSGRFTLQAFDPFKSECRPKGVDLTAELASFEKELAESEDILPEVNYSGEDIKITDASGTAVPIGSAWDWVPNAYRGLIYGPWILLILALLAGMTMIFLSTSRRKGLRRFAGGLTFAGVVLILSGLFLRPAFERLNEISTRSLGAQASFTENIVDPLFKEVNMTLSRYSVIIGIAYLVPALLTYGILIITRGHGEDSEEEEESPPVHESPQIHNEPHLAPVEQPSPAPETQTDLTPQPAEPGETPNIGPGASPRPSPQTSGRSYTRRPPMIQG